VLQGSARSHTGNAKMDRAIFDTLMDVMNESLPVFRRY